MEGAYGEARRREWVKVAEEDSEYETMAPETVMKKIKATRGADVQTRPRPGVRGGREDPPTASRNCRPKAWACRIRRWGDLSPSP
ncbi:MAG: hypothetical protein U5P41_08790 [Gammaproteobacteria bacterium]|nr:hypothetical protein [Gammaproteobacteria bacterium]